MNITDTITQAALAALQELTGKPVDPALIQLQDTRKEFEGDFTLVTFPLTKLGLGKPEDIGNKLGIALQNKLPEISGYNVVKGFLNLVLSDAHWFAELKRITSPGFLTPDYGNGKKVMVEFSSPNTNKPLHIGHLRNNFLGYSVCRILEATGHSVVSSCLVNDRGIAICKSMLMYQKYGNGATPQSADKKPDQFVVEFYVRFGDDNDAQAETLAAEKNIPVKDAELQTPLMEEAHEMLRLWEANDPPTMALWKKLNDWVYEGFEQTYKRIGISFDRMYYESDTWKLGNEIVDEGLAKGVFFRKEDGSVWIDLTADGLDQKVVRRKDGTSVYITQDIGTAEQRHEELHTEKAIYVVADEQDYHFKVLFLILKKLGRPWANGLYHLSYGMVELPEGRGVVKTRKGERAEADEIINITVKEVEAVTREHGKTEGMNEAEMKELHEKIALAALKFNILKVEPRKRMVFDPKEAADIIGFTGPFIQYAYARTRSLKRNAEEAGIQPDGTAYAALQPEERELIKMLSRYPLILREALDQYDPSAIANYAYELAKGYGRFWKEVRVLVKEAPAATFFRLDLSLTFGNILKACLDMLGIQVPERM